MVVKLRRLKWTGHVARMGKIWNEYRIFGGETNKEI
jgi:hypothetical protein